MIVFSFVPVTEMLRTVWQVLLSLSGSLTDALSLVLTVFIALIYLSQRNISQAQHVPRIQAERIRAKDDGEERFEMELSNLGKGSATDFEVTIEPCLEPKDFTSTERDLVESFDGELQLYAEDFESLGPATVEEPLVKLVDEDDQWMPAVGTSLLPEAGNVKFYAIARANLDKDSTSSIFTQAVSELPDNITAFRFKIRLSYRSTYDESTFSLLPTSLYRRYGQQGGGPSREDSELLLDYVVPKIQTDSLTELINSGHHWQDFKDRPGDVGNTLRRERLMR